MATLNSDNQITDTEIVERWQILEKESGLKFYFSGSLVTGPGWRRSILIVLHMMTVVMLFLTYDANQIIKDCTLEKWIITAIVNIWFVLTLSALLKTMFTEPGMIPKPSPEQQHKNFQTYLYIKKFLYKSPQSSVNYCKICQMFRGPRVSHCRRCNLCFKRLDHHCELFGVCIGQRNYASFFTTLTALLVFYGVVIAVGIINFYNALQSHDLNDITWDKIMFPAFYTVLFTLIYPKCGLLVLLVMPLVHLYQIATNRTTKDRARHVWPDDIPQAHSCCCTWIAYSMANFKKILLAPMIPSELDPWQKLEIPKGSLKDLKWAEQPSLSEEGYNNIVYYNPPADLGNWKLVPQLLPSLTSEPVNNNPEDPELGLASRPT